jgi:hypothetical protein
MKRWVGGAVLAPACLVTAITLIVMLWRAVTRMGFLKLGGIRLFHLRRGFVGSGLSGRPATGDGLRLRP